MNGGMCHEISLLASAGLPMIPGPGVILVIQSDVIRMSRRGNDSD